MTYKVIKPFYDRKGGATREAGTLLDISDARAKEINSAFPGTVEKEKTATVRKKAVAKGA